MTDADKTPKESDCAGDELRAREAPEDRRGDQAGDPQRGGRLPRAEDGSGDDEPRPADEAARAGIPSRSFNL